MRDRGTAVVFVAGLLLCIGIWFAVPYNNFALNNSFVSDSYLPEIALLFLSVLILAINPLLRRLAPGNELAPRHLALLTGMMLFAAVVPSNGLMRFFPHCLALDTEQINESPVLAPAIKNSKLPPSLFPDPIGFNVETPVASQLVDELDPGKTIPWKAWIPPLLSWGTFIVAFWVLMIGLGLMVYPQWRNTERLAFPLLKVYHAMIEDPGAKRLLPPVFRSRLFWIGCGVVLLIHSFNGLAIFTGGRFPEFPVSWNLSNIFTEGVWRYAPGFIKSTRLYFLFIGLAYFMPNRYSFSIWFTILFFGMVVMLAPLYAPQFQPQRLYDQGCGALIVMAGGIVWLGRRHYGHVLRASFRRDAAGDHAVDALAGRLFLGGTAVLVAWYVWAGTGVPWALFFVVTGIMIMLLVARIVAETGITYIWIIPLTAGKLLNLLPRKWMTVSTTFLQQAHYILVNRASAVSVAAMTILALGLNPTATPRSRRRLAGVALVVLLLGLFVAGAVHLHMGYTLASSYDDVNTPITGRGAVLMGLGPVSDLVSGRLDSVNPSQVKAILFGMALAAVLLVLCARFPAWPLHPIGLIFVYSSIGLRLFMSLFLGWVIKTLMVKYGGARAYRTSMPLFLGLIVGEILANALWTLVPVIQILFGADPAMIKHMVIFQYT